MSNRREKSTTHDDDVVFGSSEADRINGRRGDDFIDGGAGNDRLSGGKGDDVLQGGAGRDRVDGGNALTLIGVDMLTLHQDDSLF